MRSARLLVFVGAIGAVIGCASMGLRVGDGAARPAWELPPPAVAEAPVVTPGALHRTVLENGMRVLVLEDRRLPRAVIGIAFRRGEASVPIERAGLAAFTAELMKRGAGDRDALALAEYVDEIGASLGVSAGWDSLSVDVTGLSRDLDRLFEILSDVTLSPRFEKAEADRARDEQLASIERSKDDPATLAGWYMAQAVYPSHRFGSPLGGTPETVARFDEVAARALHAQLAIPNDAILYASGDVSIDDITARARRAFAAWQPGEILDPGAAPPAQAPAARKILIVNRPDLVQARIAVSHEGIARADDDRIPTAIMNSVLGGGGFSSRLFSRLRADEGPLCAGPPGPSACRPSRACRRCAAHWIWCSRRSRACTPSPRASKSSPGRGPWRWDTSRWDSRRRPP